MDLSACRDRASPCDRPQPEEDGKAMEQIGMSLCLGRLPGCMAQMFMRTTLTCPLRKRCEGTRPSQTAVNSGRRPCAGGGVKKIFPLC